MRTRYLLIAIVGLATSAGGVFDACQTESRQDDPETSPELSVQPPAARPTQTPARSPATPTHGSGDQADTVPDGAITGDPFHHHPASEPQPLQAPCDSNGRPELPTDAHCVARWTAFQIATEDKPPGLQPADHERHEPVEIVVLSGTGRPDRIGPDRASIEIVVERIWPTGEISHLQYDITLTRTAGHEWRATSIENH